MMKILLFVLMTMLLAAEAGAETEPVLERRLTLSLEAATLGEALDQLARLVHVKFMYSSDQLKLNERITLNVTNETLRTVLDNLLAPHGIVYRAHDKESVITLKKIKQQTYASPHDRTIPTMIRGRVTDVVQQPMAGVSIYVKGTARGTTTDEAGNFALEAEPGETLVFSSIGYVAYEVLIGTQTELAVVLELNPETLDEVMVNAGYWKVSDQNRTGNISRVTARDLEKQPVANPLMALQGRMPGVVITQTSGVAGSGIQLQIRGQNSLRNTTADNGNFPLYVIDGVPVESKPVESGGLLLNNGGIDPLNTLNPSNIESIEILKDADATSVYGSRGANGVVLITTKKGQGGRTRADIHVYSGAGRASNMIDMMNTKQYLAMRHEAFANDEAEPGDGDYDLNGTWDTLHTTNWQKELFGGTASIFDAQAAISGGDSSTLFRLGTGIHRESTVFPGDFGYQKITGNLSVNHTSADKKFTLSLSINYGADRNRLFSSSVVVDALTLAPNAPGYDAQGRPDWTGYTANAKNPFAMLNVSHTSKTTSLISNAVAGYELMRGLKFITSVGYTHSGTDQVINTPQRAMNPAELSESVSDVRAASGKGWIVEPQLTFGREVLDGRLDMLVGATWQENRNQLLAVTGKGFASDGLLGNLQAATTVTVGRDEEAQYRYHAMFGRIGYIYKERYLLNLTARRDGSSRFGSDNRFGVFGAAGAAWIFSNEGFVREHVSWLSFGKVRMSYGTAGNDRIGDYGYLSSYSPTFASYGGVPVLYPTGLANPNFGWEVNKKFEAALETGMFRDRVQSSISWYRNRSSNQLVGYPLPATTGFGTVQYNLDATVENKGWEFSVRTINTETGAWRWTTAANLTIPTNTLVSYPGLAYSSYAEVYKEGEPLTIRMLYHSLGVNPDTGEYEMEDVDEDGSLGQSDRVRIGNTGRKFYGGLQNSVSYKSFALDFFVEFVKQSAAGYQSLFYSAPGMMANQPTLILDQKRWQTDGDRAKLQRYTQLGSTSYLRQGGSDANLTDASFIRLKTIALTYTLPPKILKNVMLRDARIYVQAQNLFTITRYPGLNPESPYLELPPLRVLSAGIQLTF